MALYDNISNPYLLAISVTFLGYLTFFYKPILDEVFLTMGEFESNEELSAVIQNMWSSDVNCVWVGSELLINKGRRTFTREQMDKSSEPLIDYLDPKILERDTFRMFYDLLDNYESLVGVEEVRTHQEIIETKKFLDVIFDTKPIQIAKEYLVGKGWAPADDEEFKDWLWDIWFTLYRRGRSSVLDSSGFEHVFVGEIKNNRVIGFHNWLQFYRLLQY